MLKHAPLLYSIVTGDLPGALAGAANLASGHTQDAKVQQWTDEATQEVLFRLSREWAGRRVEELPKSSDVQKALARYREAYEQAENNEKRKILFNAFYNTFRPEFYDKSLSKVLWEKIETLEYPDFHFLAKVLENTNPEQRHVKRFGALPGGFSFPYRGHQMPIRETDEEYEWAQRLESVGLVDCGQDYDVRATWGIVLVSPKGLASKMKDFALKEIENWEPPPPPAEPTTPKPGAKKPSKQLSRAQLVGMISAMRSLLIDEAIDNPKADELLDLTDFDVSSEDTVGGELDMSWRMFDPPAR